METDKKPLQKLEDTNINVKLKLSALWAALMFVYLYVDIFGFYKPGTVEDILVGVGHYSALSMGFRGSHLSPVTNYVSWGNSTFKPKACPPTGWQYRTT